MVNIYVIESADDAGLTIKLLQYMTVTTCNIDCHKQGVPKHM